MFIISKYLVKIVFTKSLKNCCYNVLLNVKRWYLNENKNERCFGCQFVNYALFTPGTRAKSEFLGWRRRPPPNSSALRRIAPALFRRQQDFSCRHGNAGEAQWTRVFHQTGLWDERKAQSSHVKSVEIDERDTTRVTLMLHIYIYIGILLILDQRYTC